MDIDKGKQGENGGFLTFAICHGTRTHFCSSTATLLKENGGINDLQKVMARFVVARNRVQRCRMLSCALPHANDIKKLSLLKFPFHYIKLCTCTICYILHILLLVCAELCVKLRNSVLTVISRLVCLFGHIISLGDLN